MISLQYPIVGGEYKISQPFGTNPDGYPDFYKQFGYKGHNGIDFYGTKNDYIFSACDGKVITAHYDSTGYGNLTIIEDDEGGWHYYGHQNVISVRIGETVKKGVLIGYMGNTGNVIKSAYSDGTHLHYGYRPKNFNKYNGYGGFVDPMPYFEKEEIPQQSEEIKSEEGWAEIVCRDGANVRSEPAGKWETWFPKGVRVHKIGEVKTANGLLWEKIEGDYWIARSDITGTVMMQDVK